MRREFCIWLVPSAEGRVRKLRFTLSQFAAILTVTAMVATITLYMAGDYMRVQLLRAAGSIAIEKLTAERDRLGMENKKLTGEVSSLRTANADVIRYEAEIRRRVDELGAVLKSATSIGLESNEDSATARSGKPGESDAVGGLELDCDREDCAGDIEEISTGPDIGALQGLQGGRARAGSMVQTLDRYIKLLRAVPLGFPVGGEISSGYGFRVSPFSRKLTLHRGVDFSLPQGSYVYATADGKVKSVERNATYGLVIDVDHGNGIVTRYAHLSRALVKEGKKIRRGEILAHVGSTGRSTGPHLHYEVLVKGRAKNPGKFMELAYRLNGLI